MWRKEKRSVLWSSNSIAHSSLRFHNIVYKFTLVANTSSTFHSLGDFSVLIKGCLPCCTLVILWCGMYSLSIQSAVQILPSAPSHNSHNSEISLNYPSFLIHTRQAFYYDWIFLQCLIDKFPARCLHSRS